MGKRVIPGLWEQPVPRFSAQISTSQVTDEVGEGGGRTHIYLSDLGLAQLGFRGEPRSLQPVRRHLEGEPGPALEEIVMKLREAGRNRLPTPL